MKIPYQLVSMAAMLRDYIDPDEMVYLDREHKKLTDIADSLYAAVVTPDQFKDEYKKLYDEMGADYFDKVLDDMQAIDSQLTSDDKVDELWYDYEDRLNGSVTASSTATPKISASIELIDTIGYIKNANGKFDVCVVETPYADMQLATYDPVEDEYDILETVKDLDDARKKAAVQFKTQPEFVMASNNPFYDKLSAQGKKFVRDTEKKMAANEDVTVDNICKLAYMTLPAEDIDHHATDLYIRKTPESTKLINKLDNKALLSTFIDNIDHVTWYELPFCYDSRVAAKFENR